MEAGRICGAVSPIHPFHSMAVQGAVVVTVLFFIFLILATYVMPVLERYWDRRTIAATSLCVTGVAVLYYQLYLAAVHEGVASGVL